MLSAYSYRLALIEQTLASHSLLLASVQSTHEQDAAILASISRLQSQLSRSLRRIERMKLTVDRHAVELNEIHQRVVWSKGGCAIVRQSTHDGWMTNNDDDGSRL